MGLAQEARDRLEHFEYEISVARREWAREDEARRRAGIPAPTPSTPTSWSSDQRDEFMVAFYKLVPFGITYEHLADFCESQDKLAPEGLSADARGKMLLALMRPEAVAKLVKYARENP